MKKFKAFNKKEKTMSQPFELSSLTVQFNGEIDTPIGHVLRSSDYTLCQYTGIKDMGSNEIYEYDIVSKYGINRVSDEKVEMVEMDELSKSIVTIENLPTFWFNLNNDGKSQRIQESTECLGHGSSLFDISE